MSKSASRARLAEIIRKRSFGRGEITLASGRKSDFYFNLKPTMLDPEGAALLAELTYEALKDDNLDFVGGLEMGAVPLAGAIAQLSWIKGHPIAAFFVRKKPKEHGARLAVEGLAKGETLQGKRIVIVEDVTTTGGSALKAVEAVRDAGGEIVLVLTMVDREEGATEAFAEAGLEFRSLYKAGEFLKGVSLLRSPRTCGVEPGSSLGHRRERPVPSSRLIAAIRISFHAFRPPDHQLIYHPPLRLPELKRVALQRVGCVGWSWRCVQSWLFRACGAARRLWPPRPLQARLLLVPGSVSAEGLFDFLFGGVQKQQARQAPAQANFFADPFGINQRSPSSAGAARRGLRTRLLRAKLRRQIFSADHARQRLAGSDLPGVLPGERHQGVLRQQHR